MARSGAVMDNMCLPMHYVCTHEQARELIRARERFWVSNCGCREGRGRCARSRMDLCLIFTESDPGSGTGKHEANAAEVEAILAEARDQHLVARPYRDEARATTDGICFCCDDCCGYFADPTEVCDRGVLVEMTDLEACDQCGACVTVCYFGARFLSDGRLQVLRDNCYGCGLCAAVCPPACIQMVVR